MVRKPVTSMKDLVKKMQTSISTMDIIREHNPHAFALWCAKDIVSSGTKLQFTVNKNDMIVTYNVTSKDYFITYFAMENGKRKMLERRKNIDREELFSELTGILGEI